MLYIVIICVVFVVVVLFVRYKQLSLPTPMATPQRKRMEDESASLFYPSKHFLSNEEGALFKTLDQIVAQQAKVMPKVHISELATPSRANSAHSAQRSKNTVQNSHFDFLICSADELEPLCAIEINRRGLTRARGLAEKNFKLQVSAAIDLPIVFVDETSDYSAGSLRSEIIPYLPKVSRASEKPASVPAAPQQAIAAKPKVVNPPQSVATKPKVMKPKQPLATRPKVVKPQPVAASNPRPKPTNKPKPLATPPTQPVTKTVAKTPPAKRPSKTPAHPVTRSCPKCGGPMSVKTAKKGAQAGKTFLVCNDFPNCRTVLRR